MSTVMTSLFSRRQPGGIFTFQDVEAHPGIVRFVDASHAAAENALGGGRSPDKPFSTLAYAMTNAATLTPALASGDVLYVMPPHTETLAAAAAIACATAGVKIIGLGWGAARPTFTFSATTSTWTVTAASVYIKNIRITSSVAELVKFFSISAASCVLDAVDFVDAGATNTAIQFLLTTADADFLTVKNCQHWKGTAAAATEIWVELVGGDNIVIKDNVFMLTLRNVAGVRTLASTTTAPVGLLVDNNRFDQRGGTTQDLVVSMVTSTTGLYSNNRSFGDVGTLAASIALASMGASESYQATTVNKSGILDPVVA